MVCFDAVMESALKAELIDEQAEKLIKVRIETMHPFAQQALFLISAPPWLSMS